MKTEIPGRLYGIVDVACFSGADDPARALIDHALNLAASGVRWLQYRNKSGSGREMLSHARELKRALGSDVRLIMNDRADLCLAAGMDGVHVGQDDVPPELVRAIIGPDRTLGFSTHNPEQVRLADAMPIDYVAIGPVFETASKSNPDAVIGLHGVRAARALTRKPLVGIGGITRENCQSVIAAGADGVAVIADLVSEPVIAAGEFLRNLSSHDGR